MNNCKLISTNYSLISTNVPTTISGFKKSDVMVLPSHLTVSGLWRDYTQACVLDGVEARCRTVFRGIWKAVLPMLIVSKPSSDLCWQCQKHMYKFAR